MNMKKGIMICRITVVVSLVAVFALMITIANFDIENWNNTVSTIMKSLNYILWAFISISFIVMIGLQQKMKDQKTEDRIKELEQEVERLKKK